MNALTDSSIMLKYLVTNAQDLLWGITVTTVGMHHLKKEYDVYPPLAGHPHKYYFQTKEGRILDEFQLVYITKGEGKFYTSKDQCVDVKEGDIMLLMPGLWHCYYPSKKTGWNEYWIGFKGEVMDLRARNGFLNHENCIYKVGMRDEIVNLYQQAINVATTESTAYQQVLAGIANLLLGLSMAYDKEQQFENYTVLQMTKAKMIIRENIYSKITPEEIANTLNMSYSWFRKTFKEFTGLSPASYMQKLKLQAAKDSLVSTNLSIKEIAYTLHYDNSEHFSTQFKKHVGVSPKDFRIQHGKFTSSKLSD
ncbi:MAG: transcriptional regulator [Bacteroidetes bacterium]|jgi:AraC-like DNA-binding protein|nr:transcriptional regulator [Bacteroidota bacterium]